MAVYMYVCERFLSLFNLTLPTRRYNPSVWFVFGNGRSIRTYVWMDVCIICLYIHLMLIIIVQHNSFKHTERKVKICGYNI